ncbi:N-acetyltransferase [Vagococcus sp. DIV0080]|uniref:N-acetyltransferase n=1 Tax=Candidatus Vagococcus giribetii TaxID=2230876 RepID=A0ABS3HRR1_9ENTE|nr:GNAT family N-acetyltransferase [Vagococcus sp. DIV0080]MBO0476000.1 N-acetyltransferase [Vagococcus sp. DIV0080]
MKVENQANSIIILEEETVVGEISFQTGVNNALMIIHTQINEGFEGKGYGKKLIDLAVKKAKEENRKIVPICPYAKKIMLTNDTYQYILMSEEEQKGKQPNRLLVIPLIAILIVLIVIFTLL